MRTRLSGLIRKTIFAAALVSIVLWVAGVTYRLVTDQELQRVTSPDGRLEAVLVRADPGAMNDFEYFLFIVPAGRQVRDYPWYVGGDEPVLSGSGFEEDLDLAWSADRAVDVGYSRAHIYSFMNVWTSPRVDGARYLVELTLKRKVGPEAQ